LTVADRSRLPAVGADAPFAFPDIRKSRLPNGLEVWSVEYGTLPIATMVLLVRAGSSADPADRPGLASLTGDMLDEGAGDRDALGVHDALARIGAQFDTEVGPDATFLTLTTIARFRPLGLGLLADLTRRPRFDTHEFERVRQLRANRLRQLRDIPSATADRAFATALYGRHPYGHLAIGTSDALATMTLDEVKALHRRAYRPGRAVLVAVGNAPHAQIVEEIATAFAGWEDPPDAAAAAPDVEAPVAPAHRMWIAARRRSRNCGSGISPCPAGRRITTRWCW
jgi:zinc protease